MQLGNISMKNGYEIEWRIQNFYSSTMVDRRYVSSNFTISGSRWYLQLYPNGQTEEDSVGWISLYLVKPSDEPSISARFIFGIKKVDGTIEHIQSKTSWVFEYGNEIHGYPKFLERSMLQQRQSEFLPSDSESFTLTCALWPGKHFEPGGSTVTLSRNFADLFISKRGCDARVKVMDVELPVHKSILSARSPVLAAMFEADMKEKRTGLVEIEDCDPETISNFLTFLYSGKIENDSCDAFELYKIAHKYDVEDLKSECLLSIMKNISIENVLDAAILGNQFNEVALILKTENFFCRNCKKIISSAKWDDIILSDNVRIANRLLKVMAKK